MSLVIRIANHNIVSKVFICGCHKMDIEKYYLSVFTFILSVYWQRETDFSIGKLKLEKIYNWKLDNNRNS